MNQDIKQRWVAALRSGEYEQGKDYLCDNGKFCCLGVLSDIAVSDGVIQPPEVIMKPLSQTPYDGLAYDGERHHLSQTVSKWAGFDSLEIDDYWDPELLYDVDPVVPGLGKTLSYLNDSGTSFSELADLIEEHL